MRKILVCTSGRADASPLAPVVKELRERGCDVHVMGGYRFLSDFLHDFDHRMDIARPEVVLLLGDRYETGMAAMQATLRQVPIAHIHGGERTLGSFDDRIRDAVTQLASIHFTATKQAFERVCRMKSVPAMIATMEMSRSDIALYASGVTWHNAQYAEKLGGDCVYYTGAPGLDAIVDLPERKPTKTFVLTYHPETAGDDRGLFGLVEVLKDFPDYEVIWTGVNNDPGSDGMRALFGCYEEQQLTPREYILACRQAAVVIGNSSSGIIEAPTIGVPSVNIGRRQEGREAGPSVFHATDVPDIARAIHAAIAYKGPFTNPYYQPNASRHIADILVAA